MRLTQILILSLVLSLPAAASAQATLISGLGGPAGYGTECLGMNDDGSSNAIDLAAFFPAGLRFFDATHSTVFVNTNGNISFSAPVPTFTAMAFPVAAQPMIAPYWADVDIRTFDRMMGPFMRNCNGPADGDTTMGAACHNPSENGIWWHVESGRLIVTWDRVSYYKCHSDNAQRMSFQLVITQVDSAACGALGDFDVEFRYNRCEWTTGDASMGTGGFGGVAAQAGFDAGNSTDFVMIPGSRTDTIHTTLCTDSNVGDTGVWGFEIRAGEVICPGAGDPCPTGMMGVCGEGRLQCVADRIECRPSISAGAETCDALDNDCDGMVDEGTDLCAALEICSAGTCIGNCFEGGCPAGYTCEAGGGGYCVEDACVGVTCATGERCEGGTCVAPCDGITCPFGEACVAGVCADLCATATCDDCSVCVGGACAPRCQSAGCPAGESCLVTGDCVATACADVTCPGGQHCEAGSCVDDCTGAVCPSGESCVGGSCVVVPDGGVPTLDAGALVDAGVTPGVDAGTGDGGPAFDAGPGPGSGGGCGCRATGSQRGSSALFILFALGAWIIRRQR